MTLLYYCGAIQIITVWTSLDLQLETGFSSKKMFNAPLTEVSVRLRSSYSCMKIPIARLCYEGVLIIVSHRAYPFSGILLSPKLLMPGSVQGLSFTLAQKFRNRLSYPYYFAPGQTPIPGQPNGSDLAALSMGLEVAVSTRGSRSASLPLAVLLLLEASALAECLMGSGYVPRPGQPQVKSP
jgi:hypothetical protein